MQKKKTQLQDLEIQAGKQELVASTEAKNLPEKTVVIARDEAQPKKKPARKSVATKSTEPVSEKLSQQEPESAKTRDMKRGPAPVENASDHAPAGHNRWLPRIGMVVCGMIAGFLLSYFALILPLQNQLANVTEANSNGNSSSNQIKSDLSTTKLKQQEMETRYQTASNQLESANQYIFLLRMKEQIAITRLMVEQKEGLKARQSLSEIQNRFDRLKPYMIKKDAAAAEKLDGLIKVSIQHLVSDPESVKSDLETISNQLNGIETTLFQPE